MQAQLNPFAVAERLLEHQDIHLSQSFQEGWARLIQTWGFCFLFVWHGDIPSINKTLAEKDIYIYKPL